MGSVSSVDSRGGTSGEPGGMNFDEEEKIARVRTGVKNSPLGITSICADIRAGRHTEVGYHQRKRGTGQ